MGRRPSLAQGTAEHAALCVVLSRFLKHRSGLVEIRGTQNPKAMKKRAGIQFSGNEIGIQRV
jgi:hypothetical protein